VSAPVILVAEDSLLIRTVLTEQLASSGYQVIEAVDGEQAVETCQRERPDMVLLDVEMPRLDGYGVLSRLQEDPQLAEIPVVFVTSRVTSKDLVEGLRLGAHDYLRKPFEPSELLARVGAALRVKALQDELRVRNAELELISRTDALTGLFNRRHLEEHLDSHASLAYRHGTSLSVLMADVDRFKRVNDEHGHASGDAVLRVLAGRLQDSIRREDFAGRWGGEEFLIVAPHSDIDAAAILGERVRSAVASTPIPIPDGAALTVTISVGCASSGDRAWEELVRRADAALYVAKGSGRNRVVTDPPAT
jgi:two-component system cell cycle response regulator